MLGPGARFQPHKGRVHHQGPLCPSSPQPSGPGQACALPCSEPSPDLSGPGDPSNPPEASPLLRLRVASRSSTTEPPEPLARSLDSLLPRKCRASHPQPDAEPGQLTPQPLPLRPEVHVLATWIKWPGQEGPPGHTSEGAVAVPVAQPDASLMLEFSLQPTAGLPTWPAQCRWPVLPVTRVGPSTELGAAREDPCAGKHRGGPGTLPTGFTQPGSLHLPRDRTRSQPSSRGPGAGPGITPRPPAYAMAGAHVPSAAAQGHSPAKVGPGVGQHLTPSWAC